MEEEFAVLAKDNGFDPKRCDVCSWPFGLSSGDCTVDGCSMRGDQFQRDCANNTAIASRKALRKLIAEFTRLKGVELRSSRDGGRLADEVAVLIRRGVIDSRSPAGDALLDFREKPETERSCRIVELEERVKDLEQKLARYEYTQRLR